MEKAFAYVCADESAPTRLLKKYCRKIYELGYIPICPRLSDSQYLAMESADERKALQEITRQKLGRCRMLVVCGAEITSAMSAEIRRALQNNTTYQRGQNMKHTHKCKCAYWPRRHAAG